MIVALNNKLNTASVLLLGFRISNTHYYYHPAGAVLKG
jgi:hypothetical protein